MRETFVFAADSPAAPTSMQTDEDDIERIRILHRDFGLKRARTRLMRIWLRRRWMELRRR
jgi:hypothetical protein